MNPTQADPSPPGARSHAGTGAPARARVEPPPKPPPAAQARAREAAPPIPPFMPPPAQPAAPASSAAHLQAQTRYTQLRQAADAARISLIQLQIEYDLMTQRMTEIAESMQMLQNIVEIWERLDPERDILARQLARIDHDLRRADMARLQALARAGIA